MKPSHKIAFNTGVLYVKLVVVMIISLINVRLVLNALGEVDYGIFSLVAGSVSLMALLKVAMSNASMRYMAYALGSKDEKLIKKTFNTTLLLHFLLGLLMIIIIEVGGFFMFTYVFEIPVEKIADAKIVYHFMALTTFVLIIAIPYDAVINAHENLLLLSVVDIFGALLKLSVAIYLLYSHKNLLVIYGFSMLTIQFIMRTIKQVYSLKMYKECKIGFFRYYDKNLSKQIMAFSGWNLLGSVSAMSVKEVNNILLNMFFGVRINAANGISKQVSNQLSLVSSSMTRAINPQLVKSEGGGNRKRVINLTEIATKYSIFIFSLFSIPVLINLPYLLELWLNKIPDHTIIFTRLILINLLIQKFTFEITNSIRAVGKIKKFQIIETILSLLNIPAAYVLLKLDYPPYSIFYISILLTVLMSFERLYFGRTIININLLEYIKNAILPILLPIGVSSAVGIFMYYSISNELLAFFVITIQFMSMMLFLFYKYGITNDEKRKMNEMVSLGLSKIKKFRNN